MNEQILINVTPQETRVAVTEQGAVQELHIERDSSRGLVGNIYLGRVCRVLPGMQSAFVEISLPRAAFLHVADIWTARNGNGNGDGGSGVKPIEKSATTAAAQTLLYQDLSLATRVLRDLVTDSTDRIIIDSRETFQKLSDFAERYTRQALPILEHYSGERPLFDLFAVEDEIERALGRRVDLKSGGYVIIDQTEALTTVDVNTGGFVSGRSCDDTIFKTNLEASQSIARQLRLRNLGGIIIVDFIDMDTAEHRDAVLAEFRKALSRDRTRVTVNGFSQLGLVEMTRKRTRESLAHVLCEPCPVCEGRGELKTAQSVCYEALREILRTDRQFNAKEYRILASQKVIDLFLEDESASLTQLGDFIGKPISMQVETAYTQEQYDVVLV